MAELLKDAGIDACASINTVNALVPTAILYKKRMFGQVPILWERLHYFFAPILSISG